MLWSFCVLLACQAVGEALHAVTALPIPGTILGIGILLGVLACHRPQRTELVLPAADALLPYLSLMFVPPGVVALLRISALPQAWLPVAVAITVSSALALGIAGRLAQALLSRSLRPTVPSGGPRGARR